MPKKDYYKVLNVPPMAGEDEIKKAYRELSKKYHPDLNPDLKSYADEKMKELTEAYEVLTDKEKRKEYDNQEHFKLKKCKNADFNYFAVASAAKKKKKGDSALHKIFKSFMAKGQNAEEKICADPEAANMHFNLGLSMVENPSFYSLAIEEFEASVKCNPNFKEACYDLGIMNYRVGKFKEAIAAFQKLLAVDKEDVDSINMISLLKEEE